NTLIFCFLIAVCFFYFFSFFGIAPKINLFLDLFFYFILITIWRQTFNHFIKSSFQIPLAITSSDNSKNNAHEFITFIQNQPQLGYKIACIINTSLIPQSQIIQLLKKHKVQIVVINSDSQDKLNQQLIPLFLSLNIKTISLLTAYEKIIGYLPLNLIISSQNQFSSFHPITKSKKIIKQSLDLSTSLILFPFLILLYPFVAILIKLNSAGPVIYKQKRVGKNKKEFTLYKFRTMHQKAEENGPQWAQTNDPRITFIGRLLRQTHIDELPQIINVIKGQLSLVGPRPERPEFTNQLEKQIPYYSLRHLIKPGITGWAQINFRYGRSIEDTIKKLQFDLWYLKNQSIWLDLKIILKTIRLFWP
ncbi:MAG TPA: exopolysaccharide biosynthesis polyprenyl glycosylphosphotransferase, partial [Candidatus Portnoybacteria bacterium]|nr:exopolysaccharide biosynthesis polyprenyl glycosylphosphotransferase [Candidatus Portnoybacteria bacterium]